MVVRNGGEGSTLDRIIDAVAGYMVESGEKWLALTKTMPGISYFATDLDPRSFEKVEPRDTWLGRAELLLKAPAALRPGQALQEVSFTMPVLVLLSEHDGELTVAAFDFYPLTSANRRRPDSIPTTARPKPSAGVEGLIKE